MSEKISTKNLSTGDSIPKKMQPGAQQGRILDIKLEKTTFKEGGYDIMLELEGPDLGEEFEGFFIDKDNEALGRYAGQIGRVRATQWPFTDGETKAGKKIEKEKTLLRFLNNFCIHTGAKEWLDEQDNIHDTVYSLVEAFIREKPYSKEMLNWCIAGKEYENKQGYTDYGLFLPGFTKTNTPVEVPGAEKSKLYAYDPSKHIIPKSKKDVEKFEGDEETKSTAGKKDFEL